MATITPWRLILAPAALEDGYDLDDLIGTTGSKDVDLDELLA